MKGIAQKEREGCPFSLKHESLKLAMAPLASRLGIARSNPSLSTLINEVKKLPFSIIRSRCTVKSANRHTTCTIRCAYCVEKDGCYSHKFLPLWSLGLLYLFCIKVN